MIFSLKLYRITTYLFDLLLIVGLSFSFHEFFANKIYFNWTELLINLGRRHGVKIGDEFSLLHSANFTAANGNFYAGGIVFNFGYPVTVGAFQTNYVNGVDVGITKYNP